MPLSRVQPLWTQRFLSLETIRKTFNVVPAWNWLEYVPLCSLVNQNFLFVSFCSFQTERFRNSVSFLLWKRRLWEKLSRRLYLLSFRLPMYPRINLWFWNRRLDCWRRNYQRFFLPKVVLIFSNLPCDMEWNIYPYIWLLWQSAVF